MDQRIKHIATTSASYEPLDEALESISSAAPELANGFTNHAPMVIEALCAMGRGDAVVNWLAGYRPQLVSPPGARQRINDRNWRSAIGRLDCFADWQAFFDNQLRAASFAEVLDQWTMRLARGFSAAATHGPIRVGHAVRALTVAETPIRLHELASALSYWAATYQTLPSDISVGRVPETPLEAIRSVPILPQHKRRFAGSITSSLESLDEFPPFAPVIGFADLSGEPAAVLSELAETFARVYVANAHDTLSTIVFIHGVTSIAAARTITLHVGSEARRELLRYTWQSACALYAAFGARPGPAHEIEGLEQSYEALIDAAIATGDEHAIKFCEACAREDRIKASPVYRVAAGHAIAVLGGGGGPGLPKGSAA
jgi:questin oxidase-like protein